MEYPVISESTGELSNEALLPLLSKHETPFYIYNLKTLSKRCDEFKEAFSYSWFQLYFATMANNKSQVLKRLAKLNVGACVNSRTHLELAINCGFSPAKIQFSSTGIKIEDMKRINMLGVSLNVDSVNQLEKWISLGAKEVGLRVNASCLSNDRPKDRIGMNLDDLFLAKKIARQKHVKVSGLHVYIGTNLQNHKALLPTVNKLFRLAEQFNDLKYLNIGGGIGVNYEHKSSQFDISAYGHAVSEAHDLLHQKLGRKVDVIVEPGRKITADCGKMVTKVTDIKHLHGHRYITVDASIAIFPRPFHHPESPHNIWKLCTSESNMEENYGDAVIVGRTTFSRDVLGNTRLPQNIKIDDVLVFDDAGSYCQSMSSCFLGQPEPEIVTI